MVLSTIQTMSPMFKKKTNRVILVCHISQLAHFQGYLLTTKEMFSEVISLCLNLVKQVFKDQVCVIICY